MLHLMKLPTMLSPLRAPIKRQLLQRLRYDASVRVNPEDLDLAAGRNPDVMWSGYVSSLTSI